MIQHAARARLARLRGRSQPANDLIDGLVTIITPADIRAELDELNASYDLVNQQAKGDPAWDTHYAEFKGFYAETRPRTEGVTAYLKTSTGTLNGIRRRAQRLEEWKATLAKKGVAIVEPEKKPPPPMDGGLQDSLRLGLLVIAGLGVLSLVRR